MADNQMGYRPNAANKKCAKKILLCLISMFFLKVFNCMGGLEYF